MKVVVRRRLRGGTTPSKNFAFPQSIPLVGKTGRETRPLTWAGFPEIF